MRILAKNLVLSQSQILINFYLNLIFRVFFVLFCFCSLLLSGSGFGKNWRQASLTKFALSS